jgi:hypothetical protein
MKRKLKWLAVVLAVSLLGFGTALLLWPRDRITAESWQKIRIGMTEEEVAEILGGPGMDLEEALAENDPRRSFSRWPFLMEGQFDTQPNEQKALGESVKFWTGRRGRIVIQLDQDNHVCWKRFQVVRWTNAGILDRLRDWLDW